MEDNLWRKMTFDGRQHLMEGNILWKTTFDGKRPKMEDTLWWKTTFCRRQPLIEDDLILKMTFDGWEPFMEDLHWWNTAFQKCMQCLSFYSSPTIFNSLPSSTNTKFRFLLVCLKWAFMNYFNFADNNIMRF